MKKSPVGHRPSAMDGTGRRRRQLRYMTGRHSSQGSTAGRRQRRGRSGGAAWTQGEQYGRPPAAATGGTGRERRHGGGVTGCRRRDSNTAGSPRLPWKGPGVSDPMEGG